MTEHEKIPAQGGEMPPVERAAITGSGGIDTVRGAKPADNAAQERNTNAAALDRDIAHLIDCSEGGIARVPRETLVRLRALLTAPRAGLPRHVFASLECTAVWLEKGNDPQDAARELRASLAKIDAAPAAPVAELPEADPAYKPKPTLTLTGAQLLEALDFIAPDRAADQLESEVSFQHGNGHDGEGMYCWATEYPDEGAMKIDGSMVAAQAVAAPVAELLPDENSDEFHAACKMAAKAGAAGIGPCGVFIAGYRALRGIAVDVGEAVAQAVASIAAYSAPFTTDVPQCCEDPENCPEPCNAQAVGADGATTDETMSLRVALDFADNPRPTHALCAPADTNGELYRALRVLADAYRRAAVSPATADTTWKAPKQHCQNGCDVCLAGNRDGVCCPEDSCDIDDGTRKNPATADELAALREMLDDARNEFTMVREALGVAYEPHQTLLERTLDAARASQAAAPASVPPFKRYNWDGKECEAGPLVFFLDVLEALKIIEDEQAAAPASIGPVSTWPGYKRGFNDGRKAAASAEAREPVGRFDKSLNQIRWRDGLVNADFADRQPFYTYPVGAPADAGEAVAPDPIAALIARHAEELDRNDYAYFELAYTRQTGWMAWITDKPLQGPVLNSDRKVLARGQGGTPAEACRDALDADQGAQGGKGGEA